MLQEARQEVVILSPIYFYWPNYIGARKRQTQKEPWDDGEELKEGKNRICFGGETRQYKFHPQEGGWRTEVLLLLPDIEIYWLINNKKKLPKYCTHFEA